MQKSCGNHCFCCSYDFCVNYILLDQNLGTNVDHLVLHCFIYISIYSAKHALCICLFLQFHICILYYQQQPSMEIKEGWLFGYHTFFFFVHSKKPITCVYLLYDSFTTSACLLFINVFIDKHRNKVHKLIVYVALVHDSIHELKVLRSVNWNWTTSSTINMYLVSVLFQSIISTSRYICGTNLPSLPCILFFQNFVSICALYIITNVCSVAWLNQLWL